IVVVAVSVMIWLGARKSYTRDARDRVTALFAEMRTAHKADMSKAIKLWAGRGAVDMRELSSMSDGFDRWRTSNNLYHEVAIANVTESTMMSADPPAARVTVFLNGVQKTLRVPKGMAMEWIAN